jgi:hypothetical protein
MAFRVVRAILLPYVSAVTLPFRLSIQLRNHFNLLIYPVVSSVVVAAVEGRP